MVFLPSDPDDQHGVQAHLLHAFSAGRTRRDLCETEAPVTVGVASRAVQPAERQDSGRREAAQASRGNDVNYSRRKILRRFVLRVSPCAKIWRILRVKVFSRLTKVEAKAKSLFDICSFFDFLPSAT